MIVGIAGPAGSGKDTVADYLVQHHGFTKISWAGPLKAGLAAMGFPEPANRDQKEQPIEGFDFSWREAAQRLGTEFGRFLDPDIWVKLVGKQLLEDPSRNWVISDVRFENEAALIRAQGGRILRLEGRAADLGGAGGHASEKPLVLQHDDLLLWNESSKHILFLDVCIALELSYGD